MSHTFCEQVNPLFASVPRRRGVHMGMNATLPVAAATTDSVQIPTTPVRIMPGIALELEGVVWAEKLFALARPASSDCERFARSL